MSDKSNRRSFITPNQLQVRTFVFIGIAFIALLVLFIALGNVNFIRAQMNSDITAGTTAKAQEVLTTKAATQDEDIAAALKKQTSEDDASIVLFGEGDVYELLASQLFMSKHSYANAEQLDDEFKDADIIFVAKENISSSDIDWLYDRVHEGVVVVFGQIPSKAALGNAKLQKLMGIKTAGNWTKYDGVRMSEEYLGGKLIEDPEYEVSAYDLKLLNTVKIYACALPEGYEDIDDEDLPPLIWRYIASSKTGAVYVCNGDFIYSEVSYSLMPLVMRGVQDNYLYPIVNAYCTFVDGFPFVTDDEQDNWERLYSRTKLGIQQDLLMPQLERYTQVYDAVLTYFSDEAEELSTSTKQEHQYYMREIQSEDSQLALRTNGVETLFNADDPIEVTEWSAPYRLWDATNKKYELPVNYTIKADNTDELPDQFCLSSITTALGYYAVSFDIDDFMAYDGKSIWMDYCKNTEVLFGTHQRDYPWIERVTASEAVNRIYKLLNMDLDIEYFDDHVECTVNNYDGDTWFMFRTNHDVLEADGAEIATVGEGTYFITAKQASFTITWRDGL